MRGGRSADPGNTRECVARRVTRHRLPPRAREREGSGLPCTGTELAVVGGTAAALLLLGAALLLAGRRRDAASGS